MKSLSSLLVVLLCTLPAAAAEPVAVGAGSYLHGLPEGAKGPSTVAPRVSPRVEMGPGTKVPTNKWWSALAWSDKSLPQFPHPLAVQPHELGLRVTYPGSKVTANQHGIFGSMPGGKEDLVVSLGGVTKFPAPLVDYWSDWFVTALFYDGPRQLRVSYGHGSPYVYATCTGGVPRVVFAAAPKVWKNDGWTLGITAGGRHYGLFAPSSEKWNGLGTAEFTATKGDYYSVALLPDDQPETLALFAKHAHAHVTQTAVSWKYDAATQAVTSTFTFGTTPREGVEKSTLTALYPHQWRHAASPLLPHQYGSIRGPMKLFAGTEFVTRTTFPGVLPWLPPTDAVSKEQVARWLASDLSADAGAAGFKDTYWEGKQLGRLATLLAIADSAGLDDAAGVFDARLRKKLEAWFTAADAKGDAKKQGVFAYEPRWGTLIGYPASYGSDDQLNDHHFHYGYFLKAAAEIARRDPAWAADQRWGGMLRMLIRDIANPLDDPLFPRLRCFDPYAGHSWASGHAMFGDGNNNESSSEAMNAWAGLVLLGEATGDRELRDLGIWLYTTEMTAIEDYWFGVHGDTFPADYPASVVTMVWGGKGANATWFSADPQMVHGINWLPITGASLYLGRYPDYCRKNYDALLREHQAALAKASGKGQPAGSDAAWTSWIDVTLMVRSLSDPADALAQYNAAMKAEAGGKKLPYEAGHSRAALGHWIHTLDKLGTVDRVVTADTPLYAVFTKSGKRTHVAYNSGDKPRLVKFSDGVQVTVAPRSWGVSP